MKKPVCVKCGKPLSDPLSIAVGMGPDCRGALGGRGWKFPKPHWKVQGNRTVLVSISGRIQPPPLGDLTKNDRELLKRLERMKSHDEEPEDESD